MRIAQTYSDLVGNTPLLKLNKISALCGCSAYGKCEFMNPSGSVKDRIGTHMILRALQSGRILETTTVVEPTSGNTGIALASVCASLGIKLILTMPSSMSIERRKLLAALGAGIELTPAEKGMRGAVERANEIAAELGDSFIPQQFENPDNPAIHRMSTAQEIWDALEGRIDVLVAAVGTGGTLTGVGEVLKERLPGVRVVAVEPSGSPVLSGGSPAPHKIQGIGAGFVPPVLNRSIIDEIIQIGDEEAMLASRTFAKEEGVLVGISAGANLAATLKVAQRPEYAGKTIVTILCDTGERYLSTPLYGLE